MTRPIRWVWAWLSNQTTLATLLVDTEANRDHLAARLAQARLQHAAEIAEARRQACGRCSGITPGHPDDGITWVKPTGRRGCGATPSTSGDDQ
ncbi:hypothetical protein ABT336_14515 [Micromonospora sp. NPDC000207]|uniref:hypothetical protein n=1 Tax=Micromonospora sp. NPDC000207 TaxID=3154246 RepID=UPI00331F0C3D